MAFYRRETPQEISGISSGAVVVAKYPRLRVPTPSTATYLHFPPQLSERATAHLFSDRLLGGLQNSANEDHDQIAPLDR